MLAQTNQRFDHVLESWFHDQGWKAQSFQQEVWHACWNGENGLVQAPTGSGKTYAVMGPVMAQAVKNDLSSRGIKLLWVTPLRALSSDIASSAKRMIDGLGLTWQVGLRTGDTTSREKARQNQTLPQVLITTPESLHILIAQKGGARRLSEVHTIVVDEWHELVGTKRGVQTELAVSWIRHIAKTKTGQAPLIWGVSATLKHPKKAFRALSGQVEGRIVRAELTKSTVLQSVMPKAFEPLPWSGHIGLQLINEVANIIRDNNSTLVFTNTRRQSEIWYQALLSHCPEWAGLLAMHHGSVSTGLRIWVEEALHQGKLKAVVCTSSLDLGVDFAPVDAVIQIGGPKGVARMIQRAGRSGHRPGETSQAHFVPTHGLELLEAVALREAIEHQDIEPREPLIQCWDVLIQWLCTLAVGDGFVPEEVFQVLDKTLAYGQIEREDWSKCLEMIATGGPSLRAYTEHRRVEENQDGLWTLHDRSKARRHRMSMGAIVSSAMVAVQLKGVGLLGHVEESFAASLKEGESFVFAGHVVALQSLEGLVAKVRKSRSTTAKTPAWMGGRMSLSSELSHRLRQTWDRLASSTSSREIELQRLAPLVHFQAVRSHIPRTNELLVESFHDRDGHHLFLYPFEGRKVHEALASLIAYRLSLLNPQTFNWACNDDGLELLSDQPIEWDVIEGANLLSPKHLMDDLSAGFNASELVKRKFRDIATIAGLVFHGYPGSKVKERHLLTSTSLLLQVFQDHDPDNLLLRQAQDEMLADQLEFARLQTWLRSMSHRKVVHKVLNKPSPLAFPLFVDRLRERLSSESLEERLRRMSWS